jgi:hypothetical protein
MRRTILLLLLSVMLLAPATAAAGRWEDDAQWSRTRYQVTAGEGIPAATYTLLETGEGRLERQRILFTAADGSRLVGDLRLKRDAEGTASANWWLTVRDLTPGRGDRRLGIWRVAGDVELAVDGEPLLAYRADEGPAAGSEPARRRVRQQLGEETAAALEQLVRVALAAEPALLLPAQRLAESLFPAALALELDATRRDLVASNPVFDPAADEVSAEERTFGEWVVPPFGQGSRPRPAAQRPD